MNKLTLPSNKRFGLFISSMALLLMVVFFYYQLVFLGFSFLLFSVTLLYFAIAREDSLSSLNRLWMKLGIVLGKIIGPLVIGFIFFILISPISLFFKLIGRDELEVKKKGLSYWKSRDQNDISFKNQF